MKIAFASPSYGPIDPMVAHWQRFAIMNAWTNGVEVIADLSIDRLGWGRSRNVIADSALKMRADGSEIEGIFWCDTDTMLDGEAIVRLSRPDVDFMTGIYYARRPPYEPQIHVYNKDRDAFNRIHVWPDDGNPFPVNGCGFGCVYTSMNLLAEMRRERPQPDDVNKVESWWFRDNGPFGEDLDFCHRAEQAGFVLWCNPKVVVGHLGDARPIGRDDFERYMKDHPEVCGTKPTVVSVRKTDEGFEVVTEILGGEEQPEGAADATPA